MTLRHLAKCVESLAAREKALEETIAELLEVGLRPRLPPLRWALGVPSCMCSSALCGGIMSMRLSARTLLRFRRPCLPT